MKKEEFLRRVHDAAGSDDDSQEPEIPVGWLWCDVGVSLCVGLSLFQKHGVNAVLHERQAYPYGIRRGLTRRVIAVCYHESGQRSTTALLPLRSHYGIQLHVCFSSPLDTNRRKK